MSDFEPLHAYAPDDRVAVGDGGSRSARDLLKDVSVVSARLGQCNGELLVVCQDRYHLTVTLLAAWQRGIIVALPPNAREQTLSELAQRCARTVNDGTGPGDDMRSWLTSSGNAPQLQRLEPIAPQRCLATVYTSGSTGKPNACRKSAQQLFGEADTLQRTFGLGRDSCVLATVPAHHIYGFLFSIALPLAAGARFVRETPLHTPVIEEYARWHNATVLVSVPAHLHALAESPLISLAAIRCVFSSGAPLPNSTAHELHRRFTVTVREVLGSTETGGFAWRAAEQPDAPFRPFEGVGIRVGDDEQLLLTSPLLDQAITQPLLCPDRIALNRDGSFRHLGRIDGVVKVGGTRIALPELEARVRSLPGVHDAAALAVEAAHSRGHELWLVVATEAGRELPDLRNQLLRYYEPVVLPRRVRFVDVLPREATGKVPRTRLLSLFAAHTSEPRHSVHVEERAAFRTDAGAEGQRITVHVPVELMHFVGHFPGHPVLPAIVQLETLVLDEIERCWPELPALRALSRLKWKALIHPGETLVVELVQHTQQIRIDFVVRRANEVCAQGTLEFGPEPP
jgi:acyl-coenzyme A synthetase/AMP-(fatty) acid ligase